MKGQAPTVDDAGTVSDYTRETLRMMREASREYSDGYYREMMDSIMPEFYAEEEEEEETESDSITIEGDGESLAMVRGFSARLTFGDFDMEGDGE